MFLVEFAHHKWRKPDTVGEFKRGKASQTTTESLRGASPLFRNPLPLSFEGEGDRGGEVDKNK